MRASGISAGSDIGMQTEAGDSISDHTRSVKYVSLAEPSGYGIAALGYLNGLRTAAVPLAWVPLFQGPGGYTAAPSPQDAVRRLERIDLPPETSALHHAVRDVEC